MPMDGVLLNRITDNLNRACPLKINRINQPTKTDFIFQTFGTEKQRMLISMHPVHNRIHFTNSKTISNLELTHFLGILRKYLDGGIINEVKQRGMDRIITFLITNRDEIGIVHHYKLIVELLGRNANLILLDDHDQVIDAFKRIGGFDTIKRAIVTGAQYEYPNALDKKHITKLKTKDKFDSVRQNFEGVSPILEKEITERLQKENETKELINELITSNTLYIYPKDYHIIELKHLNLHPKTYPLMEGLDVFYEGLVEQERINNYTKEPLKIIRRELKRAKSKLPKLISDLEKARDSEHLREAGDLLLSYHTQAKSGLNEVTLQDWEGQPITISLNPKLNGIENANDYYKRYKKAKTSIAYLEKQIEITQNRINYFTGLQNQIEIADIEDILEIIEELKQNNLIRQKKTKKKQKRKPNYMVINYDDSTTIFVGKNNIQNDTITFKLAKKEDYWFHAANTFGAHVIIKTDEEITDDKLELCAQLAAYFSNHRHGSNVEVYYTKVKNLKKIPGQQPGMVSIQTHRSLFVTPDKDYLANFITSL